MNNLHDVPKDNGSIIRTVILGVALLNQFLLGAGYSPLPVDDAQIEFWLTSAFTAAAAIAAWWKDNDITRKARMAAKLAKEKGLKK